MSHELCLSAFQTVGLVSATAQVLPHGFLLVFLLFLALPIIAVNKKNNFFTNVYVCVCVCMSVCMYVYIHTQTESHWLEHAILKPKSKAFSSTNLYIKYP